MATRTSRALAWPLDLLFRAGTFAGVSDRQLLERFLSRHDEFAEAAFEALVLRHGPMVLGVCRRLLNDPNDADDAFQATFLVLVRKAGPVRKRESVASWLHGVARRISAHARAAAMRRNAVERQAMQRCVPACGETQSQRDIWDEVDHLPENLHAAVVLCYLEGLTHEQAAARLNWPVGTIRSRLARARAQLRARLKRYGFTSDFDLVPMLAFKSLSVPDTLINPLIKAALLIAARDAAEAGLVSATVASLTEGALLSMSITKLKSAAATLVTASCLVLSAAYAYQDGPASTKQGAARLRSEVAKAATTYRERLEGHGHPVISKAADSLSSQLVEAANRAREFQKQGKIVAALETLTQVEHLAAAWRASLVEQTNQREGLKTRESRFERPELPRLSRESAADRPAGNSTSAETQRRLDELEHMVRQIMRVIEADHRRAETGDTPKG
jgi:RNA polymerase sigma factor (sigma-70 family)